MKRTTLTFKVEMEVDYEGDGKGVVEKIAHELGEVASKFSIPQGVTVTRDVVYVGGTRGVEFHRISRDSLVDMIQDGLEGGTIDVVWREVAASAPAVKLPQKVEWIDPIKPSKERAIRVGLHGYCPTCGELGGGYSGPLVPDGKGFFKFPTRHLCPNDHAYSDEERDKVLHDRNWKEIRRKYQEEHGDVATWTCPDCETVVPGLDKCHICHPESPQFGWCPYCGCAGERDSGATYYCPNGHYYGSMNMVRHVEQAKAINSAWSLNNIDQSAKKSPDSLTKK